MTILFASLLPVPLAQARILTVRVTDASGKPARDVIVTLRPQGKPNPVPRPVTGYRIDQKDTQFHPFISVVPVGTNVSFPNLDPFKHHVYSFSPAKRFELKLFARDQTRSVTFDKPGIIAVGCNIHDSMSAFIYVTDTALTARTDAQGRAIFDDVQALPYTLGLWHPYLSAQGNSVTRPVQAGTSDSNESIAIRFRAAPMHNMSSY
ncbi:methylamine utilization protein [Sphingobium sp. EM0848]|uniref:methylamine utilization protein n=1 Tax=Sphingobium sp. EM0848 TaxID=2743473 RepID=UPI00159BFA0F|nr:methylamine utilization protein [Sphingobium sp. EM0848]